MDHSDDNDKALTLRDTKTQKHAADVAETLIRSTGERATTARVRVLGTLLASGRALTHLAVQERVAGEMAVDRVTIYRVLRWLVSQRLASATIGRDRVWRFHIPAHYGENCAHFECDECGEIHGLKVHIPREAFRVPEGYVAHAVELVVRGQCVSCRNDTPP